MTLAQIVRKLKQFGQSSKFINTTGEGDIYNYVDNGGEIVYPVMWILNKPASMDHQTITYKFSLLFADLLLEDKSNRLDIQSDQLLVARDILSLLKFDDEYLNNEQYNYDLGKNINISFFEERFDDFTAGVMVDIEIINANPINKCIIPVY